MAAHILMPCVRRPFRWLAEMLGWLNKCVCRNLNSVSRTLQCCRHCWSRSSIDCCRPANVWTLPLSYTHARAQLSLASICGSLFCWTLLWIFAFSCNRRPCVRVCVCVYIVANIRHENIRIQQTMCVGSDATGVNENKKVTRKIALKSFCKVSPWATCEALQNVHLRVLYSTLSYSLCAFPSDRHGLCVCAASGVLVAWRGNVST